LLTAREVAGQLGVCPETVLRWVRRGVLPAIRLPSGALRFEPDTFAAWKRERATPGRGALTTTPDAAHRKLSFGALTTTEDEE